MKRLATTLMCDLRLQWRNGFYAASAFVVVGSLALLRWLPHEALDRLLPLVILANVLTNSFYFVAGLVLLENGEGTRAAQAVSPLRIEEYLLSKILTLGVLSVLESLLLVAFSRGLSGSIGSLVAGLFLASVLLTLLGVACVSRFRSLNQFMMPSVAYSAVLLLPLVGWFGVGTPWLFVWQPLAGPLALMGTATAPLSAAALLTALFWTALWVAVAWAWGRRALSRSLIA
jgi:fluoroquinolone transport system permease protein